MNRIKFDLWATIHGLAAAVESLARRIRSHATRRSTALNLALLNERRS